jgi:hypothetical protein
VDIILLHQFKAMKTTKFFIALSFALIFTGINAIYSQSLNNTTGGSGSATGGGEITYVVNIVPTDGLALSGNTFFVMVTDNLGNPVSKPQPFRFGLWTYAFQETGFIKGSRTARMESNSHSIGSNAYFVTPSTLAGPFLPGRTYNFILTPVKAKPVLGTGGH